MDSNHTNVLICRVCMCHDGALKSIFALESFSEQMLLVSEVMTSCASVQMEPGDGLPQKICAVCLKRLSEAYAFKKLCEQTDSTLRNNLIIKSEEEDMQKEVDQIDITDTAVIKYDYKENIENKSERVASITEDIKQEHDSLVDEDNNVEISTSENKNSNVIKINSKKKGIYKCKICTKQLKSRTALTRHNKLHLDIKPYECDICKQRFPVKDNMERHRRTHSNVKPYMCDVCGVGFNYNSNLSKHKKHIHGPVKMRECPVCKSYFSYEDLQVHLTTHSVADKTHQCDHCGKCFTNTSKLKRHIKTHTGVECCICRKHFADKTSLGLHRSTHKDSDKTHQCSMCDKRFYTRSKLMRHMETHTGQKKPLKCLICNKCFRDSYNLRQHMRVHKGEQTDSTFRDNLIIKSEEEDMQNEVEQIDITDAGVIMYEYKENIENVSERVANISENIKEEDDSLVDEDNNKEISTSENINLFLEEEDMQKEVKQIDITDTAVIKYEYKENIENKSERVASITEDIKEEDNTLLDEDNNVEISTSENKNSNVITSGKSKQGTCKCPTCGEYISSARLWHHRKLHLDFQSYKCNICNKPIRGKQAFKNHKKTHALM